MLQSFSGGEPLLGLEEEEGGEEADTVRVQPRRLGDEGLGPVGGELVSGQLLRPRDAGPVVLGRGPQHLQHSRSQYQWWTTQSHLCGAAGCSLSDNN